MHLCPLELHVHLTVRYKAAESVCCEILCPKILCVKSSKAPTPSFNLQSSNNSQFQRSNDLHTYTRYGYHAFTVAGDIGFI